MIDYVRRLGARIRSCDTNTKQLPYFGTIASRVAIAVANGPDPIDRNRVTPVETFRRYLSSVRYLKTAPGRV